MQLTASYRLKIRAAFMGLLGAVVLFDAPLAMASGLLTPGKLRVFRQQEEDDRGSSRRRGSRRTPIRKPTENRRTAGSPSSRNDRNQEREIKRAGGPSEAVQSRLNIDAEDLDKAPEERTYQFSIVDGTYKDLVENFARMAGLGVVGEAPVGNVSFVSAQKMDFTSALSRVRLLLFKHSPIEPWWLDYQGDHLEVLRVNDVTRVLPLNQIFVNVEDFENSGIAENELAMVLYTPTDTSVADFTMLRDFMPDYVRIAPMAETNSLSIFAMVSDIKKYLSLIKLFEGAGEDPRVLIKLPVQHLEPSEAVETLRKLMDDLDETGKSTRRTRRGGNEEIDLPGQRTILFPDDPQGVIIVRAVPKQIDDIKQMLTFVDVDYGQSDLHPVLIPLEHANVDEIVTILTPLVTDERAAPKRRSSRRNQKAGAEGTATEAVSLLPYPRTNTLVVVGLEEEVARVRRYVALFDVPMEFGRPVFEPLECGDPDVISATLTQIILGEKGKKSKGEAGFTAIAEPNTSSIVLIGTRQEIEDAQALIDRLDVCDETPSLHAYRLLNAKPTHVMQIITLLESQRAGDGKATKPVRRGSRRRARAQTGAAGGNISADDESMMLYVVCTDLEWTNDYLPLIENMDRQAAEVADHVSIAVVNSTPEEVITTLNELFAAKKGGPGLKFAAGVGAVLVTGATPGEVEQIRGIVADIDHESEGRIRRLFTFKYAKPEEIKAILDVGIVDGTSQKQAGRRGRPRKSAGGEAERIITAVHEDVLVVSATPPAMDEIKDLIERLDVPGAADAETRVYNVPPGHDVVNIASLLESLLGVPNTRRGAKGAQPGTEEMVRVVPQPSARRLLISAATERFEEIENKFQMLIEGAPPEANVVKFIPVTNVEATAIAELIEPILQLRMTEMISTGELPSDVGGDGKGPRAMKQPAITVTPDINNDRIIVNAPATIVAEAEGLIAELDREGISEERIMRTITLKRTSPEDMVTVIQAMLSAEQSDDAPRKRPPSPVLRRPNADKGGDKKSSFVSASVDDVSVMTAPGGGAIVIRGTPDAVDEVERWVLRLDEQATSSNMFKVYHIVNADVEDLADTIMDLCDSGKEKPRKPMGDDLDFMPFEPLGGVRKGNDITLTTDYYNQIILVRASPTKIYEIDQVVELYDGKEGATPVLKTTEPTPYIIYELEYADAFDATIALESVLDVIWTHGDPPPVDYISGTNSLVVKCLPEYEEEIKHLIQTYVDKESESGKQSYAVDYVIVKGSTASNVAKMLRDQMSDVEIDLQSIGEEIPIVEELKPYKGQSEPQQCVLPSSMAILLGASAPGQVAEGEPDEDAEKERLAREMLESFAADAEAPAAEAKKPEAAEGKVRVRYDDRRGVLIIEGPPRKVDDVKEALEEVMEEIESVPAKADIRVFKIKYRNVNVAADILESMFNAQRSARQARGGNQAAQARRLQQMQQRMQQMQQQMRGQIPGGQGNQQPAKQGEQGQEDQQQDQQQQQGTGQIRVTPDPQNRALIVRAATEDFPIIIELLATIDRPADTRNEFKIFTLEKSLASDVEDQLKILLGIKKEEGARQSSRTTRRGGQQGQAMQEIEDALLNLDFGGDEMGAIDAAADITMTSDPNANTLLVMAPTPALELIEEYIIQLESQDTPSVVTRSYTLAHADAIEVAVHVNEIYGGGRRQRRGSESAGFDPTSVNDVKVTADARTNTIFVSAFEPDFVEIETLIDKLDFPLEEDETAQSLVLENADAGEVARTMSSLYGGGGQQRGSRAIKFVGDASSNTLFFTTPANLRDEIIAKVTELDTQAGERGKPKVITITEAKPTEIARSLQQVFDARGRRGSTKIIGDDQSGQLIVTAPDDMFAEIEALAKSMDESSLDVMPRIFKLAHASATDVQSQLTTMVRTLAQQLGSQRSKIGVFTSVADERTNSIVAVGTPTAFLLVEQVLKDVDVAPADSSQIVTAIYRLINADAAELAANIQRIYRDKKQNKGVDPPSAEANRSNNILIVRATEAQVNEIYDQVIKPVEEKASDKERVREIKALEFAEAAEVARIINDELNKTRTRSKNEEPVAVLANESLNSLVISGTREDVDLIVALAGDLDKQPTVVKDRITRVFHVAYADPGSLVGTLNNIYRRQRGSRPEEQVDVGYDWGTSKLVISASDENMAEVEKLLAEIDVESTTVRGERLIKLQYANSDELARTLSTLFRQSIRVERGQTPLSITSDPGTNSLIVFANDTEFERVSTLVSSLDVQPDASQELLIKSFNLENANPWSARNAINNLFRTRRPRSPLDEVTAVEDWSTMSVVVSASSENMARIEKFVTDFDQPSDSGGTIHVVELTHADGESVNRALQEMYRSQSIARDPRGPSIQISNPQGTNTILVKSNEKDFAEIQATIDKLDTASAESGEIEVVALQNSDAEMIQEVLENYLSKPGRRGRGGDQLKGDVRISANPQNNTLIVSGSREQLDELLGVIATLDEEVEGAGNAPRIVPLKFARASQIEPMLTQMFIEGGNNRRGGGRGRRGGSSDMAPVIAADDVSNTLIIRASAGDFSQIEQLIEQLDTEVTASQEFYTIVPVREGVQVEDLAIMVETTINEGERIKADRWGIDPGTIVVTPDQRTNTLLVAGTSALFPDVERLVSRMETMGPSGGRTMRPIRTKNISPEELKRLLDQVIDENTSSNSGRRAGRSSGSNRRSPSRRGSNDRRSPRRGGTRRNR